MTQGLCKIITCTGAPRLMYLVDIDEVWLRGHWISLGKLKRAATLPPGRLRREFRALFSAVYQAACREEMGRS